jgi:hypothetical protein
MGKNDANTLHNENDNNDNGNLIWLRKINLRFAHIPATIVNLFSARFAHPTANPKRFCSHSHMMEIPQWQMNYKFRSNPA